VISLYPHIFKSFGQFILIFNKMALIFGGVLIVFIVSSFQFQQVRWDCLGFIANDQWLQFIQPQFTGLSGLGAMLESYHKLQHKLKQFSFKNALQLMWSALPKKGTDTMKDYCRHVCQTKVGTFWTYNV